jgi:AhpD family alkylhydroperoxidase
MFDPRERLEQFRKGTERLSQEMAGTTKALFDFTGTAQKEGALTVREKELISMGIAIYNRCEDCIVYHTYNALQAGCTRKEILEAAGVGMVFGGGPSFGATASLLVATLDEFEKDFTK